MGAHEWITTAEAGRRLGVTPSRVSHWAAAGRLDGRRASDGSWRIDPASLVREGDRITRASWWRRDGLTREKAEAARGESTKRLITAALAWRDDPENADLIAALKTAVDDRRAHIIEGKPQHIPNDPPTTTPRPPQDEASSEAAQVPDP